MKHVLQFAVRKGDTQYIAEGVELRIVTQGKTLDELVTNINEAVALHLEGEDLAALGLAPRPTIMFNFELPALAHA